MSALHRAQLQLIITIYMLGICTIVVQLAHEFMRISDTITDGHVRSPSEARSGSMRLCLSLGTVRSRKGLFQGLETSNSAKNFRACCVSKTVSYGCYSFKFCRYLNFS